MPSFESTERHLTPRGWETGTIVRDSARRENASIPGDRVLTVVWAESSGGYSMPVGSSSTIWQSADRELIEVLLAKFGQAERDL